jgi:hypothetical protein
MDSSRRGNGSDQVRGSAAKESLEESGDTHAVSVLEPAPKSNESYS